MDDDERLRRALRDTAPTIDPTALSIERVRNRRTFSHAAVLAELRGESGRREIGVARRRRIQNAGLQDFEVILEP